MKTHDLARALEQLASMLRLAPNRDMESMVLEEKTASETTRELAVNLSTLARLSQIDKSQWIELIEAYQFPIELRPRDASRDVLGKLLRYLEDNPAEQVRIQEDPKNRPNSSSPAVMKALSILLAGTKRDRSGE